MRFISFAAISWIAASGAAFEDDLGLGELFSSPEAAITTSEEPGLTTREYKIRMGPRFIFGVLQRRRARALPSGKMALCPTDRTFCIDTRKSDETTCLHPDPLSIKICLDKSCLALLENERIFAERGDDSYCKDFMAMPEGRLCHWSMSPCTCDQFDLTYVDALIINTEDAIPRGWEAVGECEYPDNYKAVNVRENMADQGTLRPLPQFGLAGTTTRGSPTIRASFIATGLVALIFLAL